MSTPSVLPPLGDVRWLRRNFPSGGPLSIFVPASGFSHLGTTRRSLNSTARKDSDKKKKGFLPSRTFNLVVSPGYTFVAQSLKQKMILRFYLKPYSYSVPTHKRPNSKTLLFISFLISQLFRLRCRGISRVLHLH